MNKIIFSAVLLLAFPCRGIAANPVTDTLNIAPFGKVYVYNNTSNPQNLIIMISGDAGWKYGVVSFASTFSDMGNLVVGVDILNYYKMVRQRKDECYTVFADFVQLAADVEKKYKFADYKPPVIMGYSSGATLVYGILAQASPGTFVGGISLGFCPEIDLPRMLCQTSGLSEKPIAPGKSYYLQPDARLGNRWIVLQGELDKICNFNEVSEFVKKTTDAELVALPDVAHDFSKWKDFMPQWKAAFTSLITNDEQKRIIEKEHLNGSDLPMIITKATSVNNDAPVALMISGDGGWYNFEQQIADHLAQLGIPTVGLDSRKYFWKRKTPEQTADDMAAILTRYAREWGKDKFVLIGYSLGAEIVPFIYTRLPEEIKSKVSSSVLLSPATYTDFEIHLSNMIGMGNYQNTYNVVNEIKKIKETPTIIIFGDGENSKVPGQLSETSSIIRTVPGDHHFKFNFPLIIQIMKENNAFGK